MAEKTNISDFYFELIAKELSGEISENETSMLLEWVNKEQGNRVLYEQTIRNWDVLNVKENNLDIDTDSAWLKIKMKTVDLNEIKNEALSYSNSFSGFKIAAAILLLVGMFALAKVTLFSSPDAIEYASIDDKVEIYLPDSSRVLLNKNSHLTYYSDFNSKGRKVYLEGEAFFEVKKAQGEKFEVIGIKSITTVLGTSFNVRSLKGEESVSVVTGRVSFADKNNPDKNLVLLTPGYIGAFNQSAKISKAKITDLNFMAWKERRLVFENTQLSKVKDELEEYFGLQIEVVDPLLLNCRFTGTFEKPTADEVLEVIAVSTNLSYKIVGEKIFLTGSGCQKD